MKVAVLQHVGLAMHSLESANLILSFQQRIGSPLITASSRLLNFLHQTLQTNINVPQSDLHGL